MKGIISDNKVEYILFHLDLLFELTDEIRGKIVINLSDKDDPVRGKIFFPLSEKPLDENKILWIEEVPILFPFSSSIEHYSFKENSLYFHHDYFKSAFYLLSGFQELNALQRDDYGRFRFKDSIQYKLKAAHIPVVNYYFAIIKKGIKEFCKKNNLKFKERRYFNNYGFFLTHDVDVVDSHTLYEVIYRLKEVLGFKKTERKRKNIEFIKFLFQYLNFINRPNNKWDFTYLRDLEKRYGFISSFYFLPRGKLHQDAYYSFGEKRIVKLMKLIHTEGCEIGLHGSVGSSRSKDLLLKNLNHLKYHYSGMVIGNRYHRLLFDVNVTPQILKEVTISYDTTLGFAESEGFRNSFCLPFKLYDHQLDRMTNVWEIPLNLMDVSLFHYKKYGMEEAMQTVNSLIKEIKKFNGIFTILWHNGFIDEQLYPGVKAFYEGLLKTVSDTKGESITGIEILKRFN